MEVTGWDWVTERDTPSITGLTETLSRNSDESVVDSARSGDAELTDDSINLFH